jgi:hypothetical protein
MVEYFVMSTNKNRTMLLILLLTVAFSVGAMFEISEATKKAPQIIKK